MSGHARGEASNERLRVVVELRSVNHRFCRISARLPGEFAFFEDAARRQIQARVQRGKVDVGAQIESTASGSVRIDGALAERYGRELERIATSAGLGPPTISDVLTLPGVLVTDSSAGFDPERDIGLVERALAAALDTFDEMRLSEGAHLARDLAERLDALRAGVDQVGQAASELPARIRDTLRERIEHLLEDVGRTVDDDRIVQEAAFQAERADITEEIVRLRSHLDKASALLDSDEAVGRTLEYLAQEMHREINTIGSKTKDLSIAEVVVEMKAELEKVREQVQNLE
jgi:uncharacterized protein (TIGR00255 family)